MAPPDLRAPDAPAAPVPPARSGGAGQVAGEVPAVREPGRSRHRAADRGRHAGARTTSRLRFVRRFGLAGTLLMALGSLGAGALPVPNPLFGIRVVGLLARNATLAIALVYAGTAMLVLAWLWLGRIVRRDGLTVAAVLRTGVTWAVPLALSVPMFSRDVYGYLAQSEIAARGLDPYTLGAAQALGVDDPLTRNIPTIWRTTPSPYGPGFLVLGQGVLRVAGTDVALGTVAWRVLGIASLVLVAWAVQRLARRAGVDPALALWLAVANPLVMLHLVSGLHNESLVLGLVLAGLELTLAHRWLAAAVLISLAAALKLPALLALGFVGVHVARERGARLRDVLAAAAVLAVVAGTVLTAVSLGSGLGFGWIRTLTVPNAVVNWMSMSTWTGQLGGQLGILGGLGDHTRSVLTLTRSIGGLVSAVLCVFLLLEVLRGHLDTVTGTGLGFAAVILLGPVVHPWYLLWIALPLAACALRHRHRQAMVLVLALAALLTPPTGSGFDLRPYQLPIAILGGIAILAVVLLVTCRRRRVDAGTGPASPSLAA
ncbi:MAG: polyprenol phosphomannose-dependent alpha 1,6 mannosyltransferase MptB [Pseudonocardia sp.]